MLANAGFCKCLFVPVCHNNVLKLTALKLKNHRISQDVRYTVFLNTVTAEGTGPLHNITALHNSLPIIYAEVITNMHSHMHTLHEYVLSLSNIAVCCISGLLGE